MQKLILYSTEACHLCERALQEIELCLADNSFVVNTVDIASDPDLLREFGVSIPVLFDPAANRYLFWPFDRLAVMKFLAA